MNLHTATSKPSFAARSVVAPSPAAVPVAGGAAAPGPVENAFDGTRQGPADRPISTAKPGALTVLGLRIGRLFGGPPVDEALSARSSATSATSTPAVVDEAGRAKSQAALAQRTSRLEALIKGEAARQGGPFEGLHQVRDFATPQARMAAGNALTGVFVQALYEYRDALELTSWASKLPPEAIRLLDQQGLSQEYRAIVALSRTAHDVVQKFRPTGAFEEWTKHFAAAEASNPATAQTLERQAQCAQYASLELHRTDSFMLSRRG
jgi:hypothetical protein